MLPFFHSGMGNVQPRGVAVPRVGQHVTVTVGEPLQLQHLTCRCNQPSEDQPTVSELAQLDYYSTRDIMSSGRPPYVLLAYAVIRYE